MDMQKMITRFHAFESYLMRVAHALFLTSLLVLSIEAAAKELYVDINTGNDQVSYEQNSAENPWATLGRAVWGNANRNSSNASEAAQPGDIVIVQEGVYATSYATNQRHNPIYNPANSGTSGQPITIKAQGRVTLQANTAGDAITDGQPIIGTYSRDYIVWDGFYIDEANVNTKPDTGPVVIWDSSNVVIQNLEIRGVDTAWGDNHNAIRLERAYNSAVKNNRLYGFYGGNTPYNGSAVLMYNSSHIVIEHNTISDSNGGIYVKGGPEPNHMIIVRKNFIHNVDRGITFGVVNSGSYSFGAQTYQNVIVDSGQGITFIGHVTDSPGEVYIANNTVVSSGSGVYFKPNNSYYRSLVFRNNLFAQNSYGVRGEDVSGPGDSNFSYNLYFANNRHSNFRYTDYSFDGWQTTFGQDQTGALTSNPLFVDPNNNDFRLQSNSPALDAGIDILNLLGNGTGQPITIGAYITADDVIGVTTEPSQAMIAPAPPGLQ